MDGQCPRRRGREVRGGVVGHPAFRLAQQALRVGLADPLSPLRPGDPVEKLIERELIERESRRRDVEAADSARVQAVLIGYMVALSLGAPYDAVSKVGQFVMTLGGEARGG